LFWCGVRHTRFADVCVAYRYEYLYTIQYGKIGAGFIFRNRHSSPHHFLQSMILPRFVVAPPRDVFMITRSFIKSGGGGILANGK
jgi:hypothetical protein